MLDAALRVILGRAAAHAPGTPAADGRLLSMEGLRGFAVLLVFFVHFTQLHKSYAAALNPVFVRYAEIIGHVGVDIFFVLSGYLIYGGLMRRPGISLLDFYRRRVIRIAPTFLFVFALYCLLSALLPAYNKIPSGWAGVGYVLSNLFLLPGIFEQTPMILVAWSLSYEVAFYLMAPVAIALLSLHAKTPSYRLGALAVGTFVYAAAGSLWGAGFCWTAIGLAPLDHPRMLHFLNGAVIWELLRNQGWRKRLVHAIPQPVTLALLGAACLAAALCWDNGLPWFRMSGGMWWRTAMLMPVFILFVGQTLGAGTAGLLPQLFSWAPVRGLGNISYSFYLIHGLAMKAPLLLLPSLVPPAAAPGGPWFLLALVPLSMATALAASAALFVLVEKRFSLPAGAPQPADAAGGGDGLLRMAAAVSYSAEAGGAGATFDDPAAAASEQGLRPRKSTDVAVRSSSR